MNEPMLNEPMLNELILNEIMLLSSRLELRVANQLNPVAVNERKFIELSSEI